MHKLILLNYFLLVLFTFFLNKNFFFQQQLAIVLIPKSYIPVLCHSLWFLYYNTCYFKCDCDATEPIVLQNVEFLIIILFSSFFAAIFNLFFIILLLAGAYLKVLVSLGKYAFRKGKVFIPTKERKKLLKYMAVKIFSLII